MVHNDMADESAMVIECRERFLGETPTVDLLQYVKALRRMDIVYRIVLCPGTRRAFNRRRCGLHVFDACELAKPYVS